MKLKIDAGNPGPIISKDIYGHFSEHLGRCIYEGVWVGTDSPIPNRRGIRTDVVEALRKMGIPNLRWPGGCFADEYHWMDGIGPRETRKRMVNTNWGGVVENNHFGTHEFMDLCGQLGCEPVICGNVGSGTVQEMQQWIEYMTSDGESPMADLRRKNGRAEPWKLKYFGVGNESWGCGGSMRPEYYADEFRRYNTYVRNYGGNRVFRIACGAGGADYEWMEVLMRQAGKHMDGLSLHHYALPNADDWAHKGPATGFNEDEWFSVLKNTLFMEELIDKNCAIMDKYDAEKRVALIVDEWGTWYDVEPGTNPGFLYQQNTIRDAVTAGINLNIFNNHSSRVRMANIAQLVNVLQAVILTEGADLLLTPTYHVFEMYKVHQDATLLPSRLDCDEYSLGGQSIPRLSASASMDRNGTIHVTICNLDPNRPAGLECSFEGFVPKSVSGRILTADAMNAHNSFDAPDCVKPAAFTEAVITKEGLRAELPAKSVVMLELI